MLLSLSTKISLSLPHTYFYQICYGGPHRTHACDQCCLAGQHQFEFELEHRFTVGTLSTGANNMGGGGGCRRTEWVQGGPLLRNTSSSARLTCTSGTESEYHRIRIWSICVLSTARLHRQRRFWTKNTNKCRGYGFVDFESGACAEQAVKSLVAKGVQAQMAKVGITQTRGIYTHSQQEQDPTNLYIANLPLHFKETDLENLLVKFGQVISTRILRDTSGISKGVGFARMESKEKCEQIIQSYNGTTFSPGKEPLLVKFADGGQKKRSAYRNDNRIWREGSESGHLAYDPTLGVGQNGVGLSHHTSSTHGGTHQHMLAVV
ncbi:hypothetical protein LSTR_LSTR014369 [Laodelphax striatellus]|uniref:RRM domain-containing protein n=1 Tax=Laodelphax striatellus TaxID=195883 RepID=A0A482XM26_LAOST|nr:hypothetical protein LSTR_LSTR014369 [Laodelphax striatellus]